MRLPWASLTKPESMGCCTSAWTSVVSPLRTARMRIVDAMLLVPLSAAAAADCDFHFFGGAVNFAAGLDQRDDLAGLRHLEPVRYHARGAGRNPVGRGERKRIFRDQNGDRGDVGECA